MSDTDSDATVFDENAEIIDDDMSTAYGDSFEDMVMLETDEEFPDTSSTRSEILDVDWDYIDSLTEKRVVFLFWDDDEDIASTCRIGTRDYWCDCDIIRNCTCFFNYCLFTHTEFMNNYIIKIIHNK